MYLEKAVFADKLSTELYLRATISLALMDTRVELVKRQEVTTE